MAATPASAARSASIEYNLRPQINDRFNLSYQREMWAKTIVEVSYFLNFGTRVPYDVNLNMMDPAFRYEQKTALNTQVNNPFFGYLTPDKFPGALRNNRTVTLGSLLVPYPQYGTITQTNTNGKKLNTQTIELRGQRPFNNGFSVLAAYAYNRERIQQWFDDIKNYEVLTSGGESGWEWRPTDTPVHRLTAALTWQIPMGRGRAVGTNWNAAMDSVLGGWQYTASGRYYSGRPVFFNTSYVVSGDPKLESPTRDRWFDTSMFAVQDSFTPRSNPFTYGGLNGPAAAFTDMTLTKNFTLTSRYRLEARIEAYNVLNAIVWDKPEINLSSANFGKVTRKRVDSNGPRDPDRRSLRVLGTECTEDERRARRLMRPIRRRTLLELLVGHPLMGCLAAAQSLESIAATTAGRWRGRIEGGTHIFKGIRYGADTSTRRFRPPMPPQSWPGVRDALAFGPIAPQPSSGGRPISEDCLHLNVWTPALGTGRRPVMVWFHGGAYSSGTSNEIETDGARLSRRGDVVVVTVNHRLNAFGYSTWRSTAATSSPIQAMSDNST